MTANAVMRPLPRRIPLPQTEPPFDDELSPAVPTALNGSADGVQGTLALAFTLPSGLPVVPEPTALLHLVPEPDNPPSSTATWKTGRWVNRMAQAVAEVLAGDRPVHQLESWTSEELYDEIERRAAVAMREPVWLRSRRHRAVVRSLRVTRPAGDVLETSAVLERGPRCQAMALRFEAIADRWLCVALEIR